MHAVSFTSIVGLAACSKSGEENASNENGNFSAQQENQQVNVEARPELMGAICVAEKEFVKPEAD